MNTRRTLLACALASVLALSASAHASTINMDAIGTSSQVSGAALDGFLAPYGISVSGGSGASDLYVINNAVFYGGGALDPAPYADFLMQQTSDSGQSFTLDFSTPLDSISFTRPELVAGPNGIVAAAWRETAYNGANSVVGSNGHDAIASYANVPSQIYTIAAPDITSVTFWSDGFGYAGIEGVPMTALSITSNASEPPTLPLLGLGLAAMVGWSRWRRSRRQA